MHEEMRDGCNLDFLSNMRMHHVVWLRRRSKGRENGTSFVGNECNRRKKVQDKELENRYLQENISCQVLESETAQLRFVFDSAAERILEIRSLENAAPATDAIIENEKLKVTAESFLTVVMDSNLKGTLHATLETDMGDEVLYTYEERIDGVPTGTAVMVVFKKDGSLDRALFIYGEEAVQKAEENDVMGQRELIGEDEAITVAWRAVEELLLDYAKPPMKVESCELRGFRDEIFYEVRLTAPCNCGIDHDRLFVQKVDAYTGKPGALEVSK